MGWFASPKLSPDNSTVYFLLPDYSTVSDGLFSLRVGTEEVHFITNALKFWVVPAGHYKGCLIVWQNPMFMGGGRYDVFNMIRASGDLLGVVGFTEEAATYYIASVQSEESGIF